MLAELSFIFYRSFLKEHVWFLYVCMYTYIFFWKINKLKVKLKLN